MNFSDILNLANNNSSQVGDKKVTHIILVIIE